MSQNSEPASQAVPSYSGAIPVSSPAEARQALDNVFSLTYEELRRLAYSVRRGDPSATLSPTALVNEAWLKLANSPGVASAPRLHFKRIAARAMRQLLVEAARRRHSQKRGGACSYWPSRCARIVDLRVFTDATSARFPCRLQFHLVYFWRTGASARLGARSARSRDADHDLAGRTLHFYFQHRLHG